MSDFERNVLKEIERRGLAPRPAIYFLAKRSVFWTLAALSIVLGAISVAVGLYAIEDFYATGDRNFSDMPFDEVLTSLPIAALVCLVLFTLSAVAGLRNTRRGYRWRPAAVVAIATAASLALGLALNAADAGRAVHKFLAATFPAYAAYTYVPYDEWRRPDQGYLGGTALSVDGKTSLQLRDFDGRLWTVDIGSATINVDGDLVEEGDVAIRGTRTGAATFKAMTIDPFD
jgi:hypothetical protein